MSMPLEELAKSTTREVLKQLQISSEGSQVLILAEKTSENIAPLIQHIGQGTRVSFWDKNSQETNAKRVIIPVVSCCQMADLARGSAACPIMKIALAELLSGRPVEVFEFEYLRYQESAPESLFRLYESYEERLFEFGLKRFNAKAETTGCLRKPLLTEENILEAQQKGIKTLKVSSKTRLTPLARDCARERGIQIQKTER